MINFFVHGTPRTSGSKSGYYNKKTSKIIMAPAGKHQKSWQEAVKCAALEAGYNGKMLIEGPIRLECVFQYVRNPKDFKKHGGLLKGKNKEKITRPDLSKLVRAVEDVLTKLIWYDDSQVIMQVARKLYADQEGVRILIEEIKEGPKELRKVGL